MVWNAVADGGGAFWAALMPFSTTELTVLVISSGVSVAGRSPARCTATMPSTRAATMPTAASQGHAERRSRFGGGSPAAPLDAPTGSTVSATRTA